jgi:hypothetical protein
MSALACGASRPLLLLSARRRAVLRETLASCIDAWRSRWSTARDPVEVAVPSEAEHACLRASLTVALTFASREHNDLGVVHADADVLTSILGVSGSAEAIAGAAHGIAHEFLSEVMRSLVMELARRAQVTDVVIESLRVSQPAKPHRDHLQVSFRTGQGKARVVLSLSADMVELLAPQAATRKATTPLSLRRHAVTPERVRIEAMLGDAEVSLHDFVHLSAGDVIVLDQSLSRGGRLVLSDGQLVAPVVLGRAGERRAVSIATQSEQRSEHS